MTALVETLWQWAAAMGPTLLDSAVKGVALLLVTSLIVAAMRKKSAAARQAVWILGFAALLALPLASRALPAWQVLPGWARLDMPASKVGLAGPLGPPGGSPPKAEVPRAELPEANLSTEDPDASRSQSNPLAPPAALEACQPDQAAIAGPLRAAEQVAAAGSPPEADVLRANRPAANLSSEDLDASSKAAAPTRPTWLVWAILAWLAGAILCLAPLLLGRISLWRLARRSRRLDGPAWDRLLAQAAGALGLRRRVTLLFSERQAMPMIWGLWRARLLLPAEACQWSPQRRRAVLLHELAHAKRRDCLAKLVAHLACAAYWFNPLTWWAYKRMQAEAETACDDLVLACGAAAGPEELRPSDYATHLLEIASGLKSGMLATYSSIAMARPSKLEGRLLAILDTHRNRRALTRWGVLLAACLVASVAVPLACMRAGEGNNKVEKIGVTVLPNELPSVGNLFARIRERRLAVQTVQYEGHIELMSHMVGQGRLNITIDVEVFRKGEDQAVAYRRTTTLAATQEVQKTASRNVLNAECLAVAEEGRSSAEVFRRDGDRWQSRRAQVLALWHGSLNLPSLAFLPGAWAQTASDPAIRWQVKEVAGESGPLYQLTRHATDAARPTELWEIDPGRGYLAVRACLYDDEGRMFRETRIEPQMIEGSGWFPRTIHTTDYMPGVTVEDKQRLGLGPDEQVNRDEVFTVRSLKINQPIPDDTFTLKFLQLPQDWIIVPFGVATQPETAPSASAGSSTQPRIAPATDTPEQWDKGSGADRQTGTFVLDEDIPLQLGTGTDPQGRFAEIVRLSSIQFTREKENISGSLRVKWLPILDAKWRVTIQLLDRDGKDIDFEGVMVFVTAKGAFRTISLSSETGEQGIGFIMDGSPREETFPLPIFNPAGIDRVARFTIKVEKVEESTTSPATQSSP